MSEPKEYETKVLIHEDDENTDGEVKVNLTLLSGKTPKGKTLYHNEFMFEGVAHTLMLNKDCTKGTIKKAGGKFCDAVEFEEKQSKAKDGEEEDPEDKYRVATIENFSVFLSKSTYPGCPYYAGVRVSTYETPEIEDSEGVFEDDSF